MSQKKFYAVYFQRVLMGCNKSLKINIITIKKSGAGNCTLIKMENLQE